MNTQNSLKHNAARTALVTAAVLCLALAPAAAAQDVVQVRAGSAGIDFQPLVEHGGMVLTVAGPDGFHHREELGAGESPSFSIFDQAGGVLPDGSYKWELTAAPTDVQRREALEANQLGTRSGTSKGIEGRVQSGSFAIVDGAVVAGGETEPGAEGGSSPAGGNRLATKDQVIADDLIVQRSLCVGFDCVNGENFGFDTIRLKENNVRIKFEDTSVGSFPTNDWELTANDSASGGLSRFSILDVDAGRNIFTVEAGAPANTLYARSNGNVGLGTSTPVVDLHVKNGDSPTLRLEQDTSSGFAAQTWDVAGNEANFFVRSASTGSQLPFRIRPGAPTSSIDIAANGNVGMGTTSPGSTSGFGGISAKLHMLSADGSNGALLVENTSTTVAQRVMLELKNEGNVDFALVNNNSGDDWRFQNFNGDFRITRIGTGVGELTLDGTGDLTITGDIFTSSCSPCTSDYVFEPGYELMPIEEVAAFIDENGHLPNVPSEADYQQQGRVGLADRQIRLLEKIEELTLYTIQQQEYIAKLESRLDAIEDGAAKEDDAR